MSSQEGMDSLCVCEPTLCMGANPYKVPRTTKRVEKKKKRINLGGEKWVLTETKRKYHNQTERWKNPKVPKKNPSPQHPLKKVGLPISCISES